HQQQQNHHRYWRRRPECLSVFYRCVRHRNGQAVVAVFIKFSNPRGREGKMGGEGSGGLGGGGGMAQRRARTPNSTFSIGAQAILTAQVKRAPATICTARRSLPSMAIRESCVGITRSSRTIFTTTMRIPFRFSRKSGLPVSSVRACSLRRRPVIC